MLEDHGRIPEWLREKVPAIVEILEKYGIRKAWIFGSSLRTEKYHDIDILIDPPERFSLMDLVGLEQDISETINDKADVVVRKAVDEMISRYIRGVRIL